MDKEKLKNMHVNPVKRHLIVGGVILIILLILFLLSDYSIINRVSNELREDKIQKQIKVLNNEKDSLLRYEKELKKDTLEIERLAREKYGMVKNNEYIFFVDTLDSD